MTLQRIDEMSGSPVRVQLRRTKGWRMPPNTVSVARPHRHGNPYRVGAPDPITDKPMSAQDAVDWFRIYARRPEISASIRRDLAGHNLGCFCALNAPCHADVLLEIANSPVQASKEAA